MRFHPDVQQHSPTRRQYFQRCRLRPSLDLLEQRLVLASMISVSNASIAVSASGSAMMDFTVTRSGDVGPEITVAYTTSNGTAIGGVDYTTTSGILTIAAGHTSGTISVPVKGSDLAQGNPTFQLNLTSATLGNTPLAFSAPTIFSCDNKLKSSLNVAVGDINGDGKPDLVIDNFYSNSVSVLINTTSPGATIPSFAPKFNLSVGSYPGMVAIGDLNSDGKPDLAVTSTDTDQVSLFVNQTKPGSLVPNFSSASYADTGHTPTKLAMSDLNGDGKLDLIVANQTDNSISVILNTTSSGSPLTTFDKSISFIVGATPSAIAIGDFNGDGKPDVAVANRNASSVSVLLNMTSPGADLASFASKVDLTTGTNPAALAIGDLNGDGKLDIAVANSGLNKISILLNTSTTGTSTVSFSNPSSFLTKSQPSAITIADVNGDGLPDLVVADYGSNDVAVLLNSTSFGASAVSFTEAQLFADGPAQEPISLVTADFNGDGKLDCALANKKTGTASVLLNTTAIGISNVTLSTNTDFSVGSDSKPKSVVIGDINGDGKPDIVTANYGGNSVSVLLNTTSPGSNQPTFAPISSFTTGSLPIALSLADFNGDGKLDIAVADDGSNTVSVLFNSTIPGAALPKFKSRVEFSTGFHPVSLVAGDLNGDGKPDLAVVNENENSISVLLNTAATGSPLPSFAKKVNFATGMNPIGVAIGDLNGDGKPDLAVADSTSNAVSILLNKTGLGSSIPNFAPKNDFFIGPQPESVAIADLNGDGMPDLALTSTNQAGYSVAVLLNKMTPGSSDVSFTSRINFLTAKRPYSLASRDMNGDGKPDLVVGNFGSNTVSILLNSTAPGATVPNFADKTDFTVPSPYAIAVSDFNGDGKPDVACATFNRSSSSFLINTTKPTVSLPNLPATGTIIEEGSPTSMTADQGDNQSTYVGLPFVTNLSVVVKNTAGAGVKGITVTFTVPASGASATFPGNLITVSATTNTQGIATAPELCAGAISGAYVVTAQATGLTEMVKFTLNNLVASTKLSLVSSILHATIGQPVQFVSIVSSAGGTPDGSVSFFDGINALGSAILSAGKASLTTSKLTVGSHSITAVYSGSAGYESSRSAIIIQDVSPANANRITTTTSLSSNRFASTYGEPISFDIQVDASSGPPDGNVMVSADGITIGTVSLVAGSAHFTTTSLEVGVHKVTANYLGSISYSSSNSSRVIQSVSQAASNITLVGSQSQSAHGQAISLSATIELATAETNALGHVSFYDGSILLGTVSVADHRATLIAHLLGAGKAHIVHASYSGDSHFAAAISKPLNQSVIKDGTLTTIKFKSRQFKNPQSGVITVTGVDGGVPSGLVVFTLRGTKAMKLTLVNGSASISVPRAGKSSHSFTLKYLGDSNFNASVWKGSV